MDGRGNPLACWGNRIQTWQKMVVKARAVTLLECWCLVAVYTLEEKILVNARFYASPEKTLLYSRTRVFTSVYQIWGPYLQWTENIPWCAGKWTSNLVKTLIVNAIVLTTLLPGDMEKEPKLPGGGRSMPSTQLTKLGRPCPFRVSTNDQLSV